MQDQLYALLGFLVNGILRVLSYRNPKAGKILRGRRETLARLRAKLIPKRPTIWVHASSLGEFEQGRPLIEALRKQRSEYQIVLSFYSPSGYEVRQNYEGVDCVVYMMGDTPAEVRAFLDLVQPEKAIFVKYDFWAVMLKELERRGVETYLISAIFRPDQLFFKPWGGLYRRLLHCFTHIYVQDEASLALLKGLGLTMVSVAGDTRFDRVEMIAQQSKLIPELETMKADGSLLLIGGSTWWDEHELCWSYAQHNKDVKVVIAPHELNDTLLQTFRQQVPHSALLSELRAGQVSASEVRVLLIDCFGLLSSLYRYADVAFVGGGFYSGVHNTLEAAVYGIPVVFGQKYHKFREAGLLIEQGGAYTVAHKEAFYNLLDKLLGNQALRHRAGQAARRLVESHLGATDRILSVLINDKKYD